MIKKKAIPIAFAIIAAAFYALNISLSKYLMNDISPTMMVGLLYLGAGLGVGVLFLFNLRKIHKEVLLN